MVGKILIVNSPDCICISFLKVSHHIFKLFKQNANNIQITYSEKGKFNLGLRGITGKAAGNIHCWHDEPAFDVSSFFYRFQNMLSLFQFLFLLCQS